MHEHLLHFHTCDAQNAVFASLVMVPVSVCVSVCVCVCVSVCVCVGCLRVSQRIESGPTLYVCTAHTW